MDLRLPDLSGTEAIRAIRAEFPQARIIALSTFAGDEEIHMALEAGALAYLVKTVQPEELVDTIRKAAAGQRHVPPELAARLASRSPRSHLSPRELEVLKLMIRGKRNREIAVASRHHRGHGEDSRQQRPQQARRDGSHRSRHAGPPARHRGARALRPLIAPKDIPRSTD